MINAFVMFFARIIAYAASSAVDNDRLSTVIWYTTVFFFQIVFGILGMIVTSWFSRKREFRADAGSAKLVGYNKMIAALECFVGLDNDETEMPTGLNALAISNPPVFPHRKTKM